MINIGASCADFITCTMFYLLQKDDIPDAAAMESNYVKLLKEYNDLAEGYEQLQRHLDEETKFHQEQTSQNVAVMTDMQDTITQLRNQLAELRNTRSASSAVSAQFWRYCEARIEFGRGLRGFECKRVSPCTMIDCPLISQASILFTSVLWL